MSRAYYIAFVTFLMFFAEHVSAQYMPGNVVVHSDPRLAVLLKKNPTAAAPPTSVSYPDQAPKKGHPGTRPVQEITRNQLPSAPTHQVPVASSHEIAAVPIVKKTPTPVAAPVHQFVVPATHKDSRVLYAGKGFRVQIYNGNDREKAIKVRTEFMRQYPGMRTYFSYAAPCFRVKVGDYRNRSDAVGMLKEANSMYSSPCMIVPDDVEVHAY